MVFDPFQTVNQLNEDSYAVGNINVIYGEVLVYDVAVSALSVGNVDCIVVTL